MFDCKHPTEKQPRASASEIVNKTSTSEKAISSVVCCIQSKVWVTVVSSGAVNLKNYKKLLNVIESELKSTRASPSDVEVVLRSVFNIPKKATSTRWAFKVKSYRSSKQDRLFSDGGRSMVLIVESRLSANLIY